MRGIAALPTLLLSGCGLLGPAPRAVQSKPTVTHLATPLPEGVTQAGIQLDTSGDQMSQRGREVGLRLVVAHDTRQWVQSLASCRDASFAYPGDGNRNPPFQCDGVEWDVHEVTDGVEVMRAGRVVETIRFGVP